MVRRDSQPQDYHQGVGTASEALWKSRDLQILIEGPAGTGKTRAVLEKIHAACLVHDDLHVLLVRKTRNSMTDSVLFTFEKYVVPPGLPMLTGPARAWRHSYKYENESEIVIGGLDNSDRIMSTDYDIIAVFEATEITEADYDKLLTRLGRTKALGWHQIVLDCNPAGSAHWINQRANAGGIRRLLSRHEDNPIFYAGGKWTPQGKDYLELLDNLTGPRKERLRWGRWASAEGIVFDGYNPLIHLIPRFEIPRSWRRFWSIDFGTVHPFVAQLWAIDGDGRMFRYREIYMTGRLVSQHVLTMKKYGPPKEVECCVTDHEAQERLILKEAGYAVRPADKGNKKLGLQRVANRLEPAADGRPRIFFLEDSLIEVDKTLKELKRPLCTEQEFDGYTWAMKADGSPMSKEETVREMDDGMDGTRYGVGYADRGSMSPGAMRVGKPKWDTPTPERSRGDWG